MGCNVYLLTLRKNRKNLLDELKQKKLLHLFKKVLTAFPAATPCDNYKIKVRLLKKVCSASDVIIGDSRADILSGRLNKLTTIAVASGIRNRQYLRSLKPDYIIYNLRHLLKILLTL
jgi:phosphoglycolate phosphatase-like HAD superfamily hydrolase